MLIMQQHQLHLTEPSRPTSSLLLCPQATDANRFAIRLARHLTGRQKVLVFNYCYHGSVDETFITLQ
jgi:glutamate-1-semialdehyde aminotransferase